MAPGPSSTVNTGNSAIGSSAVACNAVASVIHHGAISLPMAAAKRAPCETWAPPNPA